MKLGRVQLVTNPDKAEAAAAEERLRAFLEDKGVAVDGDRPDLVVSLGGDGTMLRAARAAHAADAPLLGVNVGTLGYLTEVGIAEETDALTRIAEGDFDLEERMMLACRADGTGGSQDFVGLNEALVERVSHHVIRLRIRIDDEPLAIFNADGILVATPTGSTAYALSAGGPIVSPRARCLVVVPVNAHMILTRPFVLAPDQQVEITLEGVDRDADLSLDGMTGCRLTPGATVTVAGDPRPLKLVRLSGPAFIERLRIKLGLPG